MLADFLFYFETCLMLLDL